MEVERSRLETTPGRAVETLEGGLSLSRGELASALGASARTVERWRTGQTYPQHEARERLADLLALEDRLGETFVDPEAARGWGYARAVRTLGDLRPWGPCSPAGRTGQGPRLRSSTPACSFRVPERRGCHSRMGGTPGRRARRPPGRPLGRPPVADAQ